MINWEAFKDPELWIILGRMVWTLIGLVLNLAVQVVCVLAIWHGVKIEIGTAHFELEPLKQFFQ